MPWCLGALALSAYLSSAVLFLLNHDHALRGAALGVDIACDTVGSRIRKLTNIDITRFQISQFASPSSPIQCRSRTTEI
jgi:hypothetical protein